MFLQSMYFCQLAHIMVWERDSAATKLNTASWGAFLGAILFSLLYLPVKYDKKSIMNRRSLISMDTSLCMVSKSELAVYFLIFCISLIYLGRGGKRRRLFRIERQFDNGSQLDYWDASGSLSHTCIPELLLIAHTLFCACCGDLGERSCCSCS